MLKRAVLQLFFFKSVLLMKEKRKRGEGKRRQNELRGWCLFILLAQN